MGMVSSPAVKKKRGRSRKYAPDGQGPGLKLCVWKFKKAKMGRQENCPEEDEDDSMGTPIRAPAAQTPEFSTPAAMTRWPGRLTRII